MQKKHGFTLVELLVVIAIIGILAGILAPKLLRAMDSAKEQNCRNNLRQLHTGAINYALENDQMLPCSGDYCYLEGGGWTTAQDHGHRSAWVSWVPLGGLNKEKLNERPGSAAFESQFGDDLGIGQPAEFAIVNGSLFSYVDDLNAYACPVMARNKQLFMDETPANDDAVKVRRTYSMNDYWYGPLNRQYNGNRSSKSLAKMNGAPYGTDQNFQWDSRNAPLPSDWDECRVVPQPDRVIVFAETFPSPQGTEINPRSGGGNRIYPKLSPYDANLAPRAFQSVSLLKKSVVWKGRGSIELGIPNAEMVGGLHEPLIWYEPDKVFLGSAMAVYLDGHIGKVFPVVESAPDPDSDDPIPGFVAKTKANSAWFLVRGLRPAESMPGKKANQ